MPVALAAQRWRDALGEWAIPPEIRARAAASPWVLPVALFAGRARRQLAEPSGVSYQVALEALPEGGSVLDVGAGAGAASLALRERAGRITAVDADVRMLQELVELAQSGPDGVGWRTAGAPLVRTVLGSWPDVADSVPPADVVVCHHVLYNVADLPPFVAALSAHAYRRVVVELTPRHPASLLNPLWLDLHGLARPAGPTADDALEVIAGTGVTAHWWQWDRPITGDGTSYPELVDSTARRLCLGPERRADVDAALRRHGAGPEHPYLGGATRDLVTIWWDTATGADPATQPMAGAPSASEDRNAAGVPATGKDPAAGAAVHDGGSPNGGRPRGEVIGHA